jgi:DNA-binding transcriptional MerR regulator
MCEEEIQEFLNRFDDATYDMRFLCEKGKTTPRNVYFFIQRGLIPKAVGSGPSARYTEEHVARLQALYHLRRSGWTLHEIRLHLDGLTREQLFHAARNASQENVMKVIRGWLRDLAGTSAPGPGTPPSQPKPQPTRLVIADGLELLVAEKLLGRVAARKAHLEWTIRDIVGVDPPEPLDPPDPFSPFDALDPPEPPEME